MVLLSTLSLCACWYGAVSLPGQTVALAAASGNVCVTASMPADAQAVCAYVIVDAAHHRMHLRSHAYVIAQLSDVGCMIGLLAAMAWAPLLCQFKSSRLPCEAIS